MTWAKLDDRFHEHRKVKRAWRRAPASIGLHVMAITYCAGHETDGLVDAEFIEEKVPQARERERMVAALVDADLWAPEGDGWRIHGYLEFNPSRAALTERRAADAERKARGRSSQSKRTPAGRDADSNGSPPPVQAVSGGPDPTRPDNPPSPPRGNRRRDREQYEEQLASFAAEHFPGIDIGYVKHAATVLGNRGVEPITAEAMRPEVAKWTGEAAA